MYVYNCSRCGRFMSKGSWAYIYDFVAMEPSHDIQHCEKCTSDGFPALSNARPFDGDMSPYQGKMIGGEIQ